MQPLQTINEEKQRLSNQNHTSHKSRAQSVNTEGQNEIDINGTKILFPFVPYDCQLIYMQKVIETLERGTSALLESPTGTGKTLSLLCSILGWRHHLQHSHAKLKKFEMEGNSLHKRIGIPNIIYSTRTHTQLNQVVQELKCTGYNPKIAILGSREQFCVHPKVSKEKGSKQNAKCRSLNAPTSNKKCWFRQGSKHMDGVTKTVLSKHILDVEDLHLIGKDQGFCPYYHSIESCRDADLIFMPYNYLVNPAIRPPSVNVNGSVIIFDEAHNIESVCCEAVSFELKAETLAQCIGEVQSILELNKSNEDLMVSKEDLAGLKTVLLNLEKVIDEINIPHSHSNNNKFEEPSMIREGKYIFEILKKAEITKELKDEIIDIAQDVLRELVSPEAEQNMGMSLQSQNNNTSKNNKFGLETFVSALQTIFSPMFKSESFKVHLCIKNCKFGNTFGNASQRILSLWCFNPGIAIASLKTEVHAMILTSGTLSPLESFSSELQISFPIRLENKHLICAKQVLVSVLEKGPCNRTLSSEYSIRATSDYMRELGNTLCNIARRIPYGMLVFFASYQHMHSCSEFWHRTRLGNLSIMEQLQKNKSIICEPKGGGQSAVKETFAQYTEHNRSERGAILFAVMRGKISEGMDFSDNSARCVVICGIPYPYIKDPKIKAKRAYMDRMSAKHGTSKSINGQMWYQMQAIRAVNQAIGRVIRHRFDYGSIILCDRRFALARNQKNISKWIKPYIKTAKNFGLLTRDLSQFFKVATKEFDKYQKTKKSKESSAVSFVKVQRELQNLSLGKPKSAINAMMDGHFGGNNDKENESGHDNNHKIFPKYSRKRKYSDTLGTLSKFVSTPMSGSGSEYRSKKRKVNIGYEGNINRPTQYETYTNNPNISNISRHGNTPSAATKLKQKITFQNSQFTPGTQSQMDKCEKMNKIKARNLRIQSNSTQNTTDFMSKHSKNERRKKQSTVLLKIKSELSTEEYKTFKSVLKLLSAMKKSQNRNEFDENIITPFRALFCGNQRRADLLRDIRKYIPKQFVSDYCEQLMNESNKSDQSESAYVQLRKIQNEKFDINAPLNKHKRKSKRVTKKSGYNNLCHSLMSECDYDLFQKCIKEWKGINGNDINVLSNKKRVLQQIVDVLIKSCKNDMREGHMTNFRSLAAGFDKQLGNAKDKQVYHHYLQSAKEMKKYMESVRARQHNTRK